MNTLQAIFRRHGVAFGAGLAALTAFSWYVIGSFSDFYNCQESVSVDWIKFFFWKNFEFFRLPHFAQWHTDCMLYPYGVDSTFLFWSFEGNALQWLSRMLTGHFFPDQCYYVLSLSITYVGTYFLVGSRKGRFWGGAFAFALVFCHYASICKFPGHFSHAVVHWMVLSVVSDWLLVEKYWAKERFSAAFVQMKIFFWIACLGLELGYVAGIALCSSFFAIGWIFACEFVRGRGSPLRFVRWAGGNLRDLATTYRDTRWNVVLTAAILLLAWIYVPILVQIMAHAPPSAGLELHVTLPWRVLLPIFPGFNPASVSDHKWLRLAFYSTDTIYAWNAGWTFLLLFVFFVTWKVRHGFCRWCPFVALLALMFTYFPFPVLSKFPCFGYARIPERFSLFVLPAFLTPVYFAVRRFSWREARNFVSSQKAFAAFFALLFGVEFATAYACTFRWARDFPLQPVPSDVESAVKTVRDLKGDALFFFPFGVHGGNSVGFKRFEWMTAHQMHFAARCEKKMNGCYVGRMFPELYMAEFDRFGWPSYFPDDALSDEQWKKLKAFLAEHSFCAVVLESSMLSSMLHDDVVAHLGAPVCSFDAFQWHYEVIPLNRGCVNRN